LGYATALAISPRFTALLINKCDLRFACLSISTGQRKRISKSFRDLSQRVLLSVQRLHEQSRTDGVASDATRQFIVKEMP